MYEMERVGADWEVGVSFSCGSKEPTERCCVTGVKIVQNYKKGDKVWKYVNKTKNMIMDKRQL